MPSRTLHVVGAQLTFTQPEKSSGTNPASSCDVEDDKRDAANAMAVMVLMIERIVAADDGGLTPAPTPV